MTKTDVERAVRERYSTAAAERVDDLCCPVDYDDRYLSILPREILERDYGCGNPSRHLRPGETVLDLGCGAGKICYIAAQVVGSAGRVIGVDMSEEMLALAEAHRETIAERLGFSNVRFHKARIQDLALDRARLDAYLREHPVHGADDLDRVDAWKSGQRERSPLIEDSSVDVVVSNCVLNLVASEDRPQLFAEIHRALSDGGRAVISDIVCDEDVPGRLQADPELWSGCLAGAFREDGLLEAFESAGFYGMRVLERSDTPWRVIDGIEFRTMTVEAFKGKQGVCLERNQAVIYTGPWRSVTDDDGHTLRRGQRSAVCDKTFRIFSREPYASQIVAVTPYDEVPREAAAAFDCRRDRIRSPRESKGRDYNVTRQSDSTCCSPNAGD